ncbi:Rhodanese-like domain-containing protein [Halteromyces radiatus]|uniref:Rhodanese-like domain-containing protein n=1 Tax=Halteromyces radiatus TaxID=101107 RepID=UPI0022203096|nr:Rhodanese-like domain-containing protein [Halteromyces radiatus]KAI8078815.1 Rhodanese-like domain-containing protein [Halteromyces radiatus]
MSRYFVSTRYLFRQLQRSIYTNTHLNRHILSTRIRSNITVHPTPYTCHYYSTGSTFNVVDFDDIQTMIKNKSKDCHLIDVRERMELMQGYIPTAKNVPLSQFARAWSLSSEDFEEEFGFSKPDQTSTLVVYCQAGIRSAKAADYLSQLGYQKIRNYQGSWADYSDKIKTSSGQGN